MPTLTAEPCLRRPLARRADGLHHLVYPLAYAMLPIVTLYRQNAHELSPGDLVRPLSVSALLALALNLGLRRWLPPARAALMVSAGWVFLFAWQPIRDAIIPAGGTTPWLWWLLAGWLVVLAAVLAAFIRIRRGITALSRLAAVAAAVMSVAAIVGLVQACHSESLLPTRLGPDPPLRAAAPPRARLPDIYYIVLDGYARTDVLRDRYHFDNSPFMRYLGSRGFAVAQRSSANYNSTIMSAAATFNLDYLEGLARQAGRDCRDYHPAINLTANSRLCRLLRARGYRIVTVGCLDPPYRSLPADARYASPRTNPLERAAFGATFLPMLSALCRQEPGPLQAHRNRVRDTLRVLGRLPRQRPPTFVVAHVLCPHPPFVFHRDGSPRLRAGQFCELALEDSMLHTPKYTVFYRDQLAYLNTMVQESLDRLLAGRGREAVVIVQSDHGPPRRLGEATLTELMGVLIAVRLPHGDRMPLWPGVTPLNVMRGVIDRYVGYHLPRLPDRSNFTTVFEPYRFTPVTDVVTRNWGEVPEPSALVSLLAKGWRFPKNTTPAASPDLTFQ